MRKDLRQFCSVLPNLQATKRKNLIARIEVLLATGVVFQDTRRRSVGKSLTESPRGRDLGQALLLLGRAQLNQRGGSAGFARGPDTSRGLARTRLLLWCLLMSPSLTSRVGAAPLSLKFLTGP